MAGRYFGTEIAETFIPDGRGGRRQVRYLRRRQLPDPDAVLPNARHTVAARDRLDLISARYLTDPTASWQIADANGALDPDALVGPDAEGTELVIPTPGV
ncbi:hypothetical protein [Mycolicibacterium celeriflavum]|uniref:hypothetical protein n=1 Tax=Mycolicibacterium celeriflavum TaxID=1249101 RepID=UPI003CF383D1